MLYFISYDLRNPGRDYSKLYEAIKNIGSAWAHPMDSLWFVQTARNNMAPDISKYLLEVMDKNDFLFVSTFSPPDKGGWLNQEIWDWINSHR